MLPDFLPRKRNDDNSVDGTAGTDLVPASARRRPILGLALGAGAARGWAHIGVIRVFEKAGFDVRVIAGTSIGAVAGGCYASGSLDKLEQFALSLTKSRVLGLLDFRMGAGLIGGEKLRHLLYRDIGDVKIEELSSRFAAVATEIGSGHEIWLTRGPLVAALCASYAIPGVFEPVRLGGRWLFDGAVVNPIPVTLARAMGAEIVVAVNLNSELPGRGSVIHDHGAHPEDVSPIVTETASGWLGSPRRMAERMRGLFEPQERKPSFATVIVESFNITQDRISRSRLAADPPDIHIRPKLGRIGIFEFHRAAEIIALGEEAAEAALPELRELMDDVALASPSI
jgi:NTE family protein